MHHPTRRSVLGGVTVGAALTLGSSATADAAPAATVARPHRRRPSRYVVSTTAGENLEGIEVARDGTMYVTSVKTGAVFRGSTRSSDLQVWLPAGSHGRTNATGIHVDPYGRVVIAGAMTGRLFVHSRSGRLLQQHALDGEHFLNDFDFARDAVYLTDSATGTVYRSSMTARGYGAPTPLVTAADFPTAVGFLNGIQVTPCRRHLLVSDWDKNNTFRVDLRTRRVVQVQVAGGLPLGADGLLLRGRTAHAVHTDWTTERAWVRTVRLSDDYLRARVVHDSASVGFDVSPTTIAWDRGRLLWVESQLNTETQRTPYVVTEVPA